MSRLVARVGKDTYKFWLRIDSTAEFGEEVLKIIAKVKAKAPKHIKSVEKLRLVIDPAVFDLIQSMLDVRKDCTCSLYAEKEKSSDMQPLVTGAKMYGSNKDDYDRILRLIRYEV